MRFAPYHLLRGRLGPERAIEAFTEEQDPRAVRSGAEAVAVSLPPSLRASWFLGETNRFARVRAVEGGFDVFWYSLEAGFGGRFAGVLTHVDAATGAISTRSKWGVPDRFPL